MKYAVIHPDGDVETRSSSDLTNAMVFSAVGQRFRVVVGPGQALLFRADAGPDSGLDPNWLASTWAQQFLHPVDYVFGPAVVAGPADEDGHPTDLSDEVLKSLTSRTPTDY